MFNGNKIRVIASTEKQKNKIIKPKLFGFSIKISFYIYWQFRNVFFSGPGIILLKIVSFAIFYHKVLYENNWFYCWKLSSIEFIWNSWLMYVKYFVTFFYYYFFIVLFHFFL